MPKYINIPKEGHIEAIFKKGLQIIVSVTPMKKLISNKAAVRIRVKHTQQEIDNGIIKLRKCRTGWALHKLLQEKLLEEVNEYLHATGQERDNELQDVIDVCLALQGKSEKFSKGWILENTK